MVSTSNISKLLTFGIHAKCSFMSEIQDLEKEVIRFLRDNNYSYQKTTASSFDNFNRERLDALIEHRNRFYENYAVGVPEFSKMTDIILNSFLDKYYFGWMEPITMNEFGAYNINIICAFTPKLITDNPVSEKMNIDYKINDMKEMGLTFIYDRDIYHLENTGSNIDIIYSFFKDLGAWNLNIQTKDNIIQSISFCIDGRDIQNFNVDTCKIVMDTSEILNDDEITRLNKLCKDIDFVMQNWHLIGTDGGILLEDYICGISEILGYQGEIVQTVNKRRLNQLDAIEMAESIEMEIANALPGYAVRDYICDACYNFKRVLSERYGMSIESFSIDVFGNVSASLRFIAGYHYSKFHSLNYDGFKQLYDIAGENLRDSNFMVLDNERNKAQIQKLLKEIPGLSICGFHSQCKNDCFGIEKIDIAIDNYEKFINIK